MRSIWLFLAASTVVGLAHAQQPQAGSPPAKDVVATLQRYLRDTAAGGPTSFELRWQPAVSAAALAGGGRRPGPAPAEPGLEVAQGAFGTDWLLVEWHGAVRQEWLQVGRHTVTRTKGESWQIADSKQPRFDFADPQLLLRLLARNTSAVAARSIAEQGGVPVERFTLCLDRAQAEAITAAGVMFDASPVQAVARSFVKSGRGEAKDVPGAVIDVCLDVDVETHQVRRVHIRSMCKDVDMTALLRGAMRRPAAAAEEAAEDAVAPASAPTVPMQFQDGLPVRDENGMRVVWLEVVLRDHGKAPGVVLDEAQQELLGR